MRSALTFRTAALAAVLLACGLAVADGWLAPSPAGTLVAAPTAGGVAPAVEVKAADLGTLNVVAATGGVDTTTVTRAEGNFVRLAWPDAQPFGAEGTPALPIIRRLFIAPAGAQLDVQVQAGPGATTILAAPVYPAQPPIPKTPGAVENAKFVLDPAAYQVNAALPALRASVQELGLVRGQRLCQLEIYPLAYNPAANALTLYPEIAVTVKFTGSVANATDLDALPGLHNIVLNPQVLPPAGGRGGNYLICVAQTFQSAIGPFATLKAGQGFNVNTWTVAPGTTNTQMKTYIQSLWGTSNAPKYILLVGDTDTVPFFVGTQTDNPDTDLYFTCMDGSNDWYPDIAIGRLPARDANQLSAMIAKIQYYEAGPLADPGYMKRAVFMASNDNYSISEGTHNWVIQNYMDPLGFTSTKLYSHQGATTAQVSAAFNAGQIYGIYSGHGSETSWADGPPFSQANVNALTNANLYSIVCSHACLTGRFSQAECFMETWIRGANKGALCAWGSSVTSYWTEDDVLERRFFDAIYDANDPVVAEFGPVINDTKMRYLAQMGAGGSTRRYFEMYNLLGDPGCSFFGPMVPPHGMQTDPFGGFYPEGQVGGPFAPAYLDYIVKNNDATALQYEVTKTVPWLTLTNAAGTIPGGGTMTIRVALNSQANTLNTGNYTDTVTFTNLTNHDGDTTPAGAAEGGRADAPVLLEHGHESRLDHLRRAVGLGPADRPGWRVRQSGPDQRAHRAERVRLQPERRLHEQHAGIRPDHHGDRLQQPDRGEPEVLALAGRRAAFLRPRRSPGQQQRYDLERNLGERRHDRRQLLVAANLRPVRRRRSQADGLSPLDHGPDGRQLDVLRLEHRRRGDLGQGAGRRASSGRHELRRRRQLRRHQPVRARAERPGGLPDGVSELPDSQRRYQPGRAGEFRRHQPVRCVADRSLSRVELRAAGGAGRAAAQK